jgi:hypothetical protein
MSEAEANGVPSEAADCVPFDVSYSRLNSATATVPMQLSAKNLNVGAWLSQNVPGDSAAVKLRFWLTRKADEGSKHAGPARRVLEFERDFDLWMTTLEEEAKDSARLSWVLQSSVETEIFNR